MPTASLKWWGLNSLLGLGFLFCCQPKSSEKHEEKYHLSQVELGKKLFFFKGLSRKGDQNCGTCHQADSAFASARTVLSNGIRRQSASLLNLKNSTEFFWDGREKNLESLVIKPILSKDEMHGDLVLAIRKMNQDLEWRKDFALVYGRDTIYSALVARALSAFVRSLEKPFPPNQGIRQNGRKLFELHCASCHSGAATTDFKLRESPTAASGPDSGRYRITGRLEDVYFFKTPGLAGISLSPPYVHDGRYKTLEELVKIYARTLKTKDLQSPENQKELIVFLNSL
jgi:cytochrome c peroxidase